MQIKKLTEKNYILYAMHHYDNPECHSEEEFYKDLNHLKYVKRILRKYHKTQEIDARSCRLALNHIILLTNVFGVKVGSDLLFYKLDDYLYSSLKTFLIYLQSLPKTANGINTIDIPLDQNIVKYLREL